MKRYPFLLILLFISFIVISADEVEITIGAGYTAIDLDSLVEKDEIAGTSVEDWDQFNYGISVQYYFFKTGSIHVGSEILYQHLYWYSVRVPTVPYPREYSVDQVSLSIITRFDVKKNSAIDVGPVFTFANETELGFFTAFNYFLTNFDFAEIPIKLRIDVRNGKEVYFPISLSTGVLFEM